MQETRSVQLAKFRNRRAAKDKKVVHYNGRSPLSLMPKSSVKTFRPIGKAFVHLGLPKTASTALQTDFFPELARAGQITYLGKEFAPTRDPRVVMDQLPELFWWSCFTFNSSSGAPAAVSVLNRSGRDIPMVYSDERLLLHYPGSLRITKRLPRIIQYIKEAENPSSIEAIVVVRHPLELMRSNYIQCYPGIFRLDPQLDTFLKFLGRFVASPDDPCFELYNIPSLISSVQRHFDRVHVLVYETLQIDAAEFLEQARIAMGCRVNGGLLREAIPRRNSQEAYKRAEGDYVQPNLLSDRIMAAAIQVCRHTNFVTEARALVGLPGVRPIWHALLSGLGTIRLADYRHRTIPDERLLGAVMATIGNFNWAGIQDSQLMAKLESFNYQGSTSQHPK